MTKKRSFHTNLPLHYVVALRNQYIGALEMAVHMIAAGRLREAGQAQDQARYLFDTLRMLGEFDLAQELHRTAEKLPYRHVALQKIAESYSNAAVVLRRAKPPTTAKDT